MKLSKKDHNYLMEDFFSQFQEKIEYLGIEEIPIGKLVYIKRKREIPKQYIEPFKNTNEFPEGMRFILVLRYNKRDYVIDGNHRVTGAIKANYKGNFKAKVYTINNDKTVNDYINEYFHKADSALGTSSSGAYNPTHSSRDKKLICDKCNKIKKICENCNGVIL
jgi:hypothetical protein